jgi:hypothetical protein
MWAGQAVLVDAATAAKGGGGREGVSLLQSQADSELAEEAGAVTTLPTATCTPHRSRGIATAS